MRVKFLSLMLILASCVCLSSCSDDEDDKSIGNSLEGTLWYVDDEVTVFEKNEFTRYIEFVDNTIVKIWDTDGHGPYYGTYTVNGNKVYFKDLHDRYWDRYYSSATFSSRSMTVAHFWDAEQKVGPYYDTYTKE
jgi:hypothetical protein